MQMDERLPKRARKRESGHDDGGSSAFVRYGGNLGGGNGSSSSRPLAGCHLEVKPATTHLFLGQPIDVEVRLLNDEDQVQHTTMDIHVSITGDNGKVRIVCFWGVSDMVGFRFFFFAERSSGSSVQRSQP